MFSENYAFVTLRSAFFRNRDGHRCRGAQIPGPAAAAAALEAAAHLHYVDCLQSSLVSIPVFLVLYCRFSFLLLFRCSFRNVTRIFSTYENRPDALQQCIRAILSAKSTISIRPVRQQKHATANPVVYPCAAVLRQRDSHQSPAQPPSTGTQAMAAATA